MTAKKILEEARFHQTNIIIQRMTRKREQEAFKTLLEDESIADELWANKKKHHDEITATDRMSKAYIQAIFPDTAWFYDPFNSLGRGL